MNYMIDHHKQYSHMTVVDEKGKVIKTGHVLNRRREVEEFLEDCKEGLIAVIEAGRATYTMLDLLEELGVDVKMAHPLLLFKEECPPIPRRGWAEMICKVYEVDPLCCPSCGGQMKIISFIEDYNVIDRITAHLKLTFEAERPPPPQCVQQELLIEAEERGEYF